MDMGDLSLTTRFGLSMSIGGLIGFVLITLLIRFLDLRFNRW